MQSLPAQANTRHWASSASDHGVFGHESCRKAAEVGQKAYTLDVV